MLLNCGVGGDSWESLGLQGDPTSPFWRRSALGFLWREWCWSWNSTMLATWCEELTHWKRLWCWEGLGAGGEGDDRGWDGWMASPTRCTWVWVNSGSWWWTRRPGVLRFMGSQRVGHDWATELNWTDMLGPVLEQEIQQGVWRQTSLPSWRLHFRGGGELKTKEKLSKADAIKYHREKCSQEDEGEWGAAWAPHGTLNQKCSVCLFCVYLTVGSQWEWVAQGFSRPKDQTQVSWIAGRFFAVWDTREAYSWSSLNWC